MTVSISKMTISYYLRNTATGDTDPGRGRDAMTYYTEARSPAGTWFGSGLAGLNIEPGQSVDRDAAVALYEHQADPVTGEALGRPLMKSTQAPQGAKTPAGRHAKPTREGVAGFDLTFSPPKSVSALWALAGPELQEQIHQAHQQAVQEALSWTEANVLQSRAGHAGVAHVEVEGMVASLFDHWDSRNGDPQLHTHAVVSNKVQRRSDGQWVTVDSMTLHRNVVAISETYNSLLFDRLHERIGAVAEPRGTEQSISLESMLADSAPDDTEAESSSSVASRVELEGVPDELIEEFSTRAQMIEQRKDEMVSQFKQRVGRSPSAAEVLKIRQQATLETRVPKSEEEQKTLPEKAAEWRRRAVAAGHSPDQIIKDAVGHPQNTITAEMVTPEVIDKVGSWALDDVSMRRPHFSQANVRASAERVLRLVRCDTATQRDQLVSQVVDDALGKAVELTPGRMTAPDSDDPTVATRGESVFEHKRTGGVWTTHQIMAEESYLISRAEADSAPMITDQQFLEESLDGWRSEDGHPLSADQLAASRTVLSSAAGISAIIGPAGTGKTTTMSAITNAWQAQYGTGSVVGLAPSAVAAGVLGDEIGVTSENTAKWIYESVGEGATLRARRSEQNQQQLEQLVTEEASGQADPWRVKRISDLRAQLAKDHAEQAKYQLKPGQLLILDEASMVATPQFAELASQAERAGAKVLAVGDPAQLEAVDAGGFLGHMERNLEVSTLDQVWRFRNDWEKKASLALREGRESVLEIYDENGRLHGGKDIDAAEAAYAAWKADQDEFSQWNQQNPDKPAKGSILIASDNETVAALNQKAHADLVASGEVNIETTVTLRENIEAGVGDVLLARRNDRSLRDSDGEFVANGTRLKITNIRPDGSADAQVESTGADITLDKDYLAGSVELGYATTAHRAQGITVETGHAVASPGLSRELFYVAMTRGKQANHAWVEFEDPEGHATAEWASEGDGVVSLHEQTAAETPVDALKPVLARAQAQKSAHEVQDSEHGWANDLGRSVHEAAYLQWATRLSRTQQWIEENYLPLTKQQVFTDADWQKLVAADPAANHQGQVDQRDTVSSILARCQKPEPAGSGPGGMLPELTTESQAQAAAMGQVRDRISDQLAIRCAQAREEAPDWYSALAEYYQDHQVPPEVLESVVIWRAVSDQEEEPTPLGKEPSVRDHTRQYWDRLQRTLHQYGDAPEPSVAAPGMEQEEVIPEPEVPEEDWSSVEAMLTDFEEVEASLDAEMEVFDEIDFSEPHLPAGGETELEEMFIRQRQMEETRGPARRSPGDAHIPGPVGPR